MSSFAPYITAQTNQHHQKSSSMKSKRHNCNFCSKHFNKKGNLLNHISREHKEEMNVQCGRERAKRYSAHASSTVFEDQLMLKQQVNIHEKQKIRLKCKMCTSFFVKEKTLSTHMMKFHFLFKCPECDEYFNQKAGLKLHQTRCHAAKILPKNVAADDNSCQFCGKRLRTEESMVAHLTEVHDCLKCASCGKWCRGSIGLNTHMNRCKSSQKGGVYKCHICHKSFMRLPSLVSHVKTCLTKMTNSQQINGNQKNPDGCVCKICQKQFVSRSALAGHLTHCMKSYKCSICSKGYSLQSELDRHIRIFHTGEKPYPCKRCGKRFPHIKLLKVHIEVVHKQNNLNSLTGARKKTHKCIVCRKVFPQQSFLKMHMKIHTNEKRLKCGICGEKFSNEKTIIEHINIFHVPGGCQGVAGDMEYIVECVDSWDQQVSQQVNQQLNQSHLNGIEPATTAALSAAPPQPNEDLQPIEEHEELHLNLTLSTSSSSNNDDVLSLKPVTNHPNQLDTDTVSLKEDPLKNQHLPQLLDTIAAKETPTQEKLLQAILADVSQNNPSSVSNHLNFIKGTCENAIVDVTQNICTSLPSSLPCTEQQKFKIDVDGHCEQDSSFLPCQPYTYSGHQSDPGTIGGAAETDSSLTVSVDNDDDNDEDYYVTVNEYSDEENGEEESAIVEITDEKKPASIENLPENDNLQIIDDVNDDCSTVPEIQGYSLKDQPYITEDDLHGINGENILKMALNCDWDDKQIEMPINCNSHEQNQTQPIEQQEDLSMSNCDKSNDCKERIVQHICGVCQQIFESVKELQQHKASSHSLKCAQCQQQYTKMMDLLNHYETCNYSNHQR